MKNIYLYEANGTYVAAQDDENRFHWAPSMPEMKRPGTALAEHTLLEDAAAIIELNGYRANQARGIVAQHDIDSSWIKDTMSSKQIAEALFAKADIARYYAYIAK